MHIVKKIPFLIFFLFFLFSSHSSFAENESKPSISSEPKPIDILKLEVTWWNYFRDQDNETRQQQLTVIENLITQVPEVIHDEGIYTNTQAILALYSNTLKITTKLENPWATKRKNVKDQTYSLQEVLASFQTLERLKQTLNQQRQQIERLSDTIKQGKDSLQNVKTAYLETNKTEEQRQVYRLGLQWIHDRLQIAIVEHQLVQLYQKDKQVSAFIEVGKTLSVNIERLAISEKERQQMEVGIKALDKSLVKKRKQLAEVRLQFIHYEGEAQGGQEDFEAQQNFRVLTLEAEVTLEEIQRYNLIITHHLVLVLQPPKDLDTTEYRRTIKKVEAFSQMWEEQIVTLRTQTHTERIQASNRLLALTNTIGETDILLKSTNETRIKQADNLLSKLQRLQYELNQKTHVINLLNQQLKKHDGLVTTVVSFSQINLEQQWQDILGYLNEPLFEINETPVTSLGVLRFFLILFVAWVISRLIRMALRRVAKSHVDDNNIAFVLSKIIHYVILLFAFLIALSSLNIDVTRFALLASALSIGIGFGLQNIVSNFVSGIILLFEKSIKVGDFIEFESGVRGQVKEMNIRSTLISTNDNIDIVVPNADFVNGHVTNWTMREAVSRLRINFGVAYGTDRQLVHDIVLEAALNIPYTLLENVPEPRVRLTNFGDNSLDFQLLVWITSDVVKRPGLAKGAYLWAVADALEEHNIEIPFPQRDLHIRSGVLPIETIS